MQVSSDSDDEPHVFKRPCLAGNRHQHCKSYICRRFAHIANACPDQDELQLEATTSDDTKYIEKQSTQPSRVEEQAHSQA